MVWTDLFAAFALFLVLEGLLPFASPQGWREAMLALAQQSDSVIRAIGFFSMLAGLIILIVVRS